MEYLRSVMVGKEAVIRKELYKITKSGAYLIHGSEISVILRRQSMLDHDKERSCMEDHCVLG